MKLEIVRWSTVLLAVFGATISSAAYEGRVITVTEAKEIAAVKGDKVRVVTRADPGKGWEFNEAALRVNGRPIATMWAPQVRAKSKGQPGWPCEFMWDTGKDIRATTDAIHVVTVCGTTAPGRQYEIMRFTVMVLAEEPLRISTIEPGCELWELTNVTPKANDTRFRVTLVELMDEGECLCASTSPPFELVWGAGTAPPGRHSLWLRCVDSQKREYVTPSIDVTVPHPVVVVSPQPQHTVEVTADVTTADVEVKLRPDVRPARVSALLNGNEFTSAAGAPFSPLQLDLADVYPGRYALAAQVETADGATLTSPDILIDVKNQPLLDTLAALEEQRELTEQQRKREEALRRAAEERRRQQELGRRNKEREIRDGPAVRNLAVAFLTALKTPKDGQRLAALGTSQLVQQQLLTGTGLPHDMHEYEILRVAPVGVDGFLVECRCSVYTRGGISAKPLLNLDVVFRDGAYRVNRVDMPGS